MKNEEKPDWKGITAPGDRSIEEWLDKMKNDQTKKETDREFIHQSIEHKKLIRKPIVLPKTKSINYVRHGKTRHLTKQEIGKEYGMQNVKWKSNIEFIVGLIHQHGPVTAKQISDLTNGTSRNMNISSVTSGLTFIMRRLYDLIERSNEKPAKYWVIDKSKTIEEIMDVYYSRPKSKTNVSNEETDKIMNDLRIKELEEKLTETLKENDVLRHAINKSLLEESKSNVIPSKIDIYIHFVFDK